MHTSCVCGVKGFFWRGLCCLLLLFGFGFNSSGSRGERFQVSGVAREELGSLDAGAPWHEECVVAVRE